MNRRGFLASPLIAFLAGAVSKVRKRLARKFVTVGKGGDHRTLRAALAEVSEAGGGTVYVLPGIHELEAFETSETPVMLIGGEDERPTIRWRA